MKKNLNIAQIGHPILRKKTKKILTSKIKSKEIQDLINKMINIMHDANGAGLAANQIYEPFSICVIEVFNNNINTRPPNTARGTVKIIIKG